MKKAMFILPTAAMGGAERVTRLLADAAVESGEYDLVELVFLCGTEDRTQLNTDTSKILTKTFLGAKRELFAFHKLIYHLAKGRRYAFVFSSHTHVNAILSLLRYAKIYTTKRLATRESTLIFERNFGHLTWLIKSLYKLYGAQDLIICQTDRMARSLINHTSTRLHHKVATIPNPVSIARERQSSDLKLAPSLKDGIKIAWCGRLIPIKNPRLAIDTVVALKEKGFFSTLTFIGDGPLRGELEQYARECNIFEQITFTGFISEPSGVFERNNIGLITSHLEGFPNIVLEMLGSNISAVVTTDCAGGLADLPDVNVVSQSSASNLAETIIDIATICKEPNTQSREIALTEREPSSFLKRCNAFQTP